ncbi:MAG: NTP transferase domain-containing protein [Candidatus Lokiarchaeota archaeon]|nr:NTP transferase domain-containing protein [Candidatus Lokiarchaeota archaeon]
MGKYTAVVLAGGIGSRLRPLTSLKPKPMIPVVNKPMIHYAIDLLRYNGINDIIVVVKYLGDKIRNYIEARDWNNINIQIPEVNSLDTADALRKVSDYIEGDNIIVSMADIITNINLKDNIEFFEEKNAFSTISMISTDKPQQFGVILLDNEQKIYLFLEKPGYKELVISSIMESHKGSIYLYTNLINTGLYIFKRKILDILNSVELMDFGNDVFPYLLERDVYDLYGYIEKYYWMDAGKPTTYKWTNWDIMRKWAWPILPAGEEIRNNIWIGKNCKIPNENILKKRLITIGNNVSIQEDVEIIEQVVIGDNTEIGSGSTFQNSILWDNIKIGKNCKFNDSIICNNVTIGDNVDIFNSIIGANTEIGDNYKLEPWKIIEPNSKLYL